MSSFLKKYCRRALLGLMLLLAGAANLVCFSYDADNDEDTPPVTIELHVVAPQRSQHAQAQTASRGSRAATYHLNEARPVFTEVASLYPGAAPQLTEQSPQLVVPLRR